jgi:predicted Zn-ribbon and HTH transcriptional regulator
LKIKVTGMSTGQDLFCSQCDFTLQSGWSHHTISQHCVCINCANIFSIKGFQSPWGVGDGQICHIYQSITSKKQRKRYRDRPTEIDTGIRVVGETSIQESILESGKTVNIETFTFGLQNIACPCCHQKSLKLSLEVGIKCPKCKVGDIQSHGMIEY